MYKLHIKQHIHSDTRHIEICDALCYYFYFLSNDISGSLQSLFFSRSAARSLALPPTDASFSQPTRENLDLHLVPVNERNAARDRRLRFQLPSFRFASYRNFDSHCRSKEDKQKQNDRIVAALVCCTFNVFSISLLLLLRFGTGFVVILFFSSMCMWYIYIRFIRNIDYDDGHGDDPRCTHSPYALFRLHRFRISRTHCHLFWEQESCCNLWALFILVHKYGWLTDRSADQNKRHDDWVKAVGSVFRSACLLFCRRIITHLRTNMCTETRMVLDAELAVFFLSRHSHDSEKEPVDSENVAHMKTHAKKVFILDMNHKHFTSSQHRCGRYLLAGI